MTAQIIDPERLKQMRKSRGFTQAALADEARLNPQRVYQLERGRCRARKGTCERLAEALRVEPGVLTGEKPIPKAASRATSPPDRTRLNVQVGASIRNAFEEVADHYEVSVRWIAQVAPLLFVIVAEASLKQRRKKLEELEAELDRSAERISGLGLDSDLGFPTYDQQEVIYGEEESIESNDLFGLKRHQYYRHSEDSNPFAAFLKELTKGSDTTVSLLGPNSIEYRVCGSEATTLTLAQGEEPEEPEEEPEEPKKPAATPRISVAELLAREEPKPKPVEKEEP